MFLFLECMQLTDLFDLLLFSKEIKILIDGIKGGTPEQISSFIEYIVKYHGPGGILARTLPTGRTIFWVIIIFALFLLLTFLS